MITIQINNNKGRLLGGAKQLIKLQKDFKVRNPGAFFIRKTMGARGSNWDGKINYITDSYYFQIGLLPMVIKKIEEYKFKYEIEDHRIDLNIKPKLPKYVGDKKLRDNQRECVKRIIRNKVSGIPFPTASVKAATNFGKTLIMAGIYLAYRRKIPALILLNDADLFEQFKKEIPALLPDTDIKFIRGRKKNDIIHGHFTVAMVQSLSAFLVHHKNHLDKYGILLVDEADLANNKTYKRVIAQCINSVVTVGLSATLYMGKLAKHKPNNMALKGLFSDIIYEIGKKEMQDKGLSTKVIIKIVKGNQKPGNTKDWQKEYKDCITNNADRAIKCVDRVKFNAKLGRIPALVVCRYHDHINFMYRVFKNQLGHKYIIKKVHGDTPNRNKIITDFRVGKIDILIGSHILKRGKNFPLLRYVLNAAAGDSAEAVDQILGRLERTHKDKKRAYMEDMFDEGTYLKRHSKHRVNYYKQMGLKIKEVYK